MLNSLSITKYSLATSEFRSLPKQKRAAIYKLMSEKSFQKCAIETNMSRSSLIRAVKSEMEGRECGTNGRPPILREEEQKEFVKRVNLILAEKEEIGYDEAISIAKEVIMEKRQYVNSEMCPEVKRYTIGRIFKINMRKPTLTSTILGKRELLMARYNIIMDGTTNVPNEEMDKENFSPANKKKRNAN